MIANEPKLYFFESGKGGPIKIGFTKNDPTLRKEAQQTGNPEQLYYLGSLVVEGQHAEAETHKRFEHLHIRGEWFKRAKELVDWLSEKLNTNLDLCNSYK